VSGELEGERYDLRAVTAEGAADASGVPHERELLALADAVVRGDAAELATAREGALAALGAEAFVAAAAVAANFERMDRVADATGIPLDAPLDVISAEMRAELGIVGFGSAANTPRMSAPRRLLGRALAPFARFLMPLLARRSRRSGTSAASSRLR
jgi:hypothetical protein